jgi:hypothetical protein
MFDPHRSRIGRLPIAEGTPCDVPMFETFGPHVLKTFKAVTELADDPSTAI